MSDLSLKRALPGNVDAEQLILGGIFVAPDSRETFQEIAAVLNSSDFSLQKHRTIWKRMKELYDRDVKIDRITVTDALVKAGQLKSVDGLSYLISLDDGLPQIYNLEGYVGIVKEASVRRRIIFHAQSLVDMAIMESESIDDLLGAAENGFSEAADALQGNQGAESTREFIESLPGGAEALVQGSPTDGGIDTPWVDINRLIIKIGLGDLVILAGRPGMGKSVAGMQMAYHTARTTGLGVHYHSLEMKKQTLVERLMAGIARIPADLIRARSADLTQRAALYSAIEEIADTPLYIDDDPRRHTVMAIAQSARRVMRKRPLGLIVVDHLQLMKSPGRHKDRREELTEGVHSLKRLAGELNVPIMVLSQLNRQCEIERRSPGMADLKETGAIEEDADLVWFVHRPEMYRHKNDEDKKKLTGYAEFIIGKHRNGMVGTRKVTFQHRLQRFVLAANEVDTTIMAL